MLLQEFGRNTIESTFVFSTLALKSTFQGTIIRNTVQSTFVLRNTFHIVHSSKALFEVLYV